MPALKARSLSRSQLEGYGQPIDERGLEPLDENEDFTYWDKITELEMGDVASTGVVHAYRDDLVFEELERHLRTPETLVVLEGDAIVVCGQTDENDEIVEPRPFLMTTGEAMSMYPGTWHSPPAPADGECRVLVLFRSGTPENDLEIRPLSEPVEVKLG